MSDYSIARFALLVLIASTASTTNADGCQTFESELYGQPHESSSATQDSGYEPLTASLIDNSVASQESRIARLEAELWNLQKSFARNVAHSPDQIFTQPCNSCSELYGSIEVTFLRPRVSGAMPAFSAANGGRLIENSFETGLRYILGYRNAQGLGIRGRYWSYDHDFIFAAPFGPGGMDIRAQTADLELTQLQHFCNWDLEASGGVRYGTFGYESNVAGAFGVGEVTFEGVGPTASLDARRSLGQSGLDVFGNVRGSLLFGGIHNASMLLSMPRGQIRDEVAQTLENQLGVAWTRTFSHSSRIEISAAWETQYWLNDTLADDVFGIGSNLGFMGPAVSVGFQY